MKVVNAVVTIVAQLLAVLFIVATVGSFMVGELYWTTLGVLGSVFMVAVARWNPTPIERKDVYIHE